MAVVSSGEISLLKIWSEKNENDYSSNNADGETDFSLRGMSSNSHNDSSGGNINLNSAGGGGGVVGGSAPWQMSEFYGYDHDASSGPAVGSYGNGASNVMFTGNQGTGQVTVSNVDLSSAAYVGQSLIGATGHVYFRFESGTSFRSDAQLTRLVYNNGTIHKTFSTSGVNSITTTSATTNATYNHSSTWIQVASGTTNARWNQLNGTPASSGTGVNADALYYESSGNGNNKDVYLRFPEVTFAGDTLTFEGYGYGSNMGTLYLGVYITG